LYLAGRSLFGIRIGAALALIVVLALIFDSQSDGVFLTSRNLSLLLREAAIVALLAGGVAIVMIMGEIDLSIGSAVYFAGIVAASAQVDDGAGPYVALALAIGFGLLLGLWHGFWIVKMAVPSFIVTLASLLALRGLGLAISDAQTIGPLDPGFIDFSESYLSSTTTYVLIAIALGLLAMTLRRERRVERAIGRPFATERLSLGFVLVAIVLFSFAWVMNGFLGTPTAVLWMAGVGIALWFVMSRTTFGRDAYMIGANRDAATLAGVNVGRTIAIGFLIMGALYGIAGVLLDARLGSSAPGTGQFLELEAIAAAVIGGTSLRGGIGTVPAAMAGALLLAMIDNGMEAMNVSSFEQQVVKGGILLAAVALDSYVSRRPRKLREDELASAPPEPQEPKVPAGASA
jgi:D-xylose transport system permease protein